MRNNRGSILVEDAKILTHQAFSGYQHILRIHAPEIARASRPGAFVHIRCEPGLAMRRPMSIMRTSCEEGWVEMLYKQVGVGTKALASRVPGEILSVIGPIGVPFSIDPQRSRPLLLGGGVGIPPMLFLAENLHSRLNELNPLMIMGSEVPFPFELSRADTELPGIPAEINTSLAMVEHWGIPSRLSSLQDYPGCFRGYITDLARAWIEALPVNNREQVAVYACGPTPMLKAVAKLADEFSLPCQVSLEEHMACALGGCAGCTVRVKTAQGEVMQRVCVDGPVFAAQNVFYCTDRATNT